MWAEKLYDRSFDGLSPYMFMDIRNQFASATGG
jgi:hypothetical protein